MRSLPANLDTLDLLQFLDAALHLLRLSGLVAEAVDEDFQLLDALALVAIRRLELFAGAASCSPDTCRNFRCRSEFCLFQISAILLTVTSRK